MENGFIMKPLICILAVLVSFAVEAKPKQKHKKMALKDSLVAMWNMGQDPALYQVWDRSYSANHLTGVNFDPDETPPGSLVDGKVGKAITFDGVNQLLSIASNSGFGHQGGEFTVAIWFRPTMLAHQKTIASTTEWGVSTILSGGNFYISVSIEDETVEVTEVPLLVDQWYLIMLGYVENTAFDTSFVWAAVNTSSRVKSLQTGLTPAASEFYMGGTPAIGWINATIDDVAIWRRALSATELLQIYNNGDGLAFDEWDKVVPCRAIQCCD